MTKSLSEIKEYYMQIKEYLDSLIIGENHAKEVIVSALLCSTNSRILMSGKPGTAKTTLSDSLEVNFKSKKISMVGDLLPSDILEILKACPDLECLQLEEINRSRDATQAALIELFASNTITTNTGREEFGNFYVFATQNDSEIAGIFNTPQALYDRFDINLNFGNITADDLEKILFDYHKKIKKANFNLLEMCKETSKAIDEFAYSKIDRRLLTEAALKVKTTKYNDADLFASSTIRGDLFAIRMATLRAMLYGKKFVLPSDFAEYISEVYLHRIDQRLLKMNSKEAANAMDEIKKEVLSLERPGR